MKSRMLGPRGHRFPYVTVALLAALAPAPARSAPDAWRLVAQRPIAHAVSTAAFLDERTGLAAHCIPGASHPALLHTRDGGATWAAARTRAGCRIVLELLPQRAWSTGDMGYVETSRDGGRSWKPVGRFGGAIPNNTRYLSFADARRGAIASHADVGVTRDGGKSWSGVRRPAGMGELAGLSLSRDGSVLVLRILDSEGRMWASRDSGATWVAVPTPLQHPLFEFAGGPRSALRFPSATEGVLVAILEEDELPVGRVYRTLDGGASWTEEQVEGGLWPSPIAISSDATVITSLDRGVIRLYLHPAPAP